MMLELLPLQFKEDGTVHPLYLTSATEQVFAEIWTSASEMIETFFRIFFYLVWIIDQV